MLPSGGAEENAKARVAEVQHQVLRQRQVCALHIDEPGLGNKKKRAAWRKHGVLPGPYVNHVLTRPYVVRPKLTRTLASLTRMLWREDPAPRTESMVETTTFVGIYVGESNQTPGFLRA